MYGYVNLWYSLIEFDLETGWHVMQVVVFQVVVDIQMPVVTIVLKVVSIVQENIDGAGTLTIRSESVFKVGYLYKQNQNRLVVASITFTIDLPQIMS